MFLSLNGALQCNRFNAHFRASVFVLHDAWRGTPILEAGEKALFLFHWTQNDNSHASSSPP